MLKHVYVISGRWTPYVSTTSSGQEIDTIRFWAGGAEWSPHMQDAVMFPSEKAARRQVDQMNLREWTITAFAI